jgi:hypothetical protein
MSVIPEAVETFVVGHAPVRVVTLG